MKTNLTCLFKHIYILLFLALCQCQNKQVPLQTQGVSLDQPPVANSTAVVMETPPAQIPQIPGSELVPPSINNPAIESTPQLPGNAAIATSPPPTENAAIASTPPPPGNAAIASSATIDDGIPVAKPVPGRPGVVYNPYNPNEKISVMGIRPGAKAKDSKTGKVFRVPY
jgi:hypothetical protein